MIFKTAAVGTFVKIKTTEYNVNDVRECDAASNTRASLLILHLLFYYLAPLNQNIIPHRLALELFHRGTDGVFV